MAIVDGEVQQTGGFLPKVCTRGLDLRAHGNNKKLLTALAPRALQGPQVLLMVLQMRWAVHMMQNFEGNSLPE